MDVQYVNHLSVEDYNYLRKSAQWSEVEGKQAAIGIHHSAFLIAAVVNGKTVGMARVVSDGGYIAIIVDVVVLPDYQGKGIGKAMMQKIMDYLNGTLEKGQFVFVNLMAAKNKEPFYASFGFEVRPNDNVGAGMTQYLHYTPPT